MKNNDSNMKPYWRATLINDCRPIKFLRLLLILEFLFLSQFPIPSTLASEHVPFKENVPFKRSVSDERVELFVLMLKRRAQQILETRRIPPPPLISLSAGITQGYESNVNLNGTGKGDFFNQETFGILLRPRFNSWLSVEMSYDLYHSHFHEIRDANLWMNTLTADIHIQAHDRARIETGYEFSIVNFPFNTANSFSDQRSHAHFMFAHTNWLTHRLGWTYQLRDFDTRKARDTLGISVDGTDREDNRHIASYEMRLLFPKTSVRILSQFYENSSNDLLSGFYDWEDYQVRGLASHALSDNWIAVLMAGFERRNYSMRTVPNINIAERDNLVTLSGSLIYPLSEGQITYSLIYRHQDSNDPRLDFIDWINQIGFSINF